MLTALTAAFGWCAWAFAHVVDLVSDVEGRPVPTTIVEVPEPTVGERR